MKIGILQTGRSPEVLQEKYQDYDKFFERFLSGRGFTFQNYQVLDGEFPDSPKDAEGWLITGSRFGVYEDHAWIAPLEDFLRDTFAAGIPIFGVCFGHQILAQALGGKVEKFAGGWSVGQVNYKSEKFGDQSLLAWHQDQVVERPSMAEVVASSDFCENAMLVYGNKAMTIQPHPEFTADFMSDLLDARGDLLPTDVKSNASQTLAAPLTRNSFADIVEAFFKQSQKVA